jgi:small neutral amino acid transporter SnatA (MarC family)
MYKDDDVAHADRANSLIDEIAELERQKVTQMATDQRLEAAKRELASLQATPAPVPPPRGPGMIAHLIVFSATAGAAYLGYTLLVV